MFSRRAKNLIGSLTADYQPLNLVELDSGRVLGNLKFISQQHPNYQIMAVLKSNAYGHGLTQMATILNKADCSFIAVDGYFEAAKIRGLTLHKILVMGYIKPENAKLLDTELCSFVVQDITSLHALGKLGRTVHVHLELNTGMNRLGLQPDEIDEYLACLKNYPNITLEGIMSHLADADNETDDNFTDRQVKLFDSLVERILASGYAPKFIHLAQTAGSAKAKSRYANALRLGIGLYGINPLSPKDKRYSALSGLQPVLALKSTVIKTLDLKKGDKVSYNGIFTAPADMHIGVLPLGYYEGLSRELSNSGCVTAGGKVLPIVGRVCMNHTMIDLGKTNLAVGDQVTVISADKAEPNYVQRICAEHNLFSYSFVTGLSETIKRVVV